MAEVEIAATPPITPESIVLKRRIIKRKQKPAPAQVNNTLSEPPPPTGLVYNLWYNKWSGGDREDQIINTPAKGRYKPREHTGYTRARDGSFFCLQVRDTHSFDFCHCSMTD